MEGLHTLAERHDQAFNSLLEQFRGFPTGQQVILVISQPTPVSREPCLPLPECYTGDSRSQGSLPVLPHFRAAAFFVPLGPLEDSVHHTADVSEGTRLGHGDVGATVRQ
jgi:hypothetical protein